MCDQTEVHYKVGDIVWVKLGFCWWPGEVYDLQKLPEEILSSFRKPPIVAVKFFDEEKFEYVKTIDTIYFYNCTKKNEFIKKGLSLYRSKKRNMTKFPEDVTTAEIRIGGDPNIIQNPIFIPDERPDYTSIFGSGKSKKTKKSSTPNKTLSLSFGSTSSATSTPNRSATHPRFVGHNDHVIRILIQTPPSTDESNADKEEERTYDCHLCGFKTVRVNVIMMHVQSHNPTRFHIDEPITRIHKKSPKKRKVLQMTKSSTSSLLEDLQLIEKGAHNTTESSDEDVSPPKRPRNENHRKHKRIKPLKTSVKKKDTEAKDLKYELLAEWDVESDSEINVSSGLDRTTDITTADESSSKLEDLLSERKENIESDKEQQTLVKLDLQVPEVSKSCFDFEEEDEDNETLSTSIGRKIPRVIPLTERQKVVDSEYFVHQKGSECEINSYECHRDADMEAFKNILEITTVPCLPEIPQVSTNLISSADKWEKPAHNEDEESFNENEKSFIERDKVATAVSLPTICNKLETKRCRSSSFDNEQTEEIDDSMDLLVATVEEDVTQPIYGSCERLCTGVNELQQQDVSENKTQCIDNFGCSEASTLPKQDIPEHQVQSKDELTGHFSSEVHESFIHDKLTESSKEFSGSFSLDKKTEHQNFTQIEGEFQSPLYPEDGKHEQVNLHEEVLGSLPFSVANDPNKLDLREGLTCSPSPGDDKSTKLNLHNDEWESPAFLEIQETDKLDLHEDELGMCSFPEGSISEKLDLSEVKNDLTRDSFQENDVLEKRDLPEETMELGRQSVEEGDKTERLDLSENEMENRSFSEDMLEKRDLPEDELRNFSFTDHKSLSEDELRSHSSSEGDKSDKQEVGENENQFSDDSSSYVPQDSYKLEDQDVLENITQSNTEDGSCLSSRNDKSEAIDQDNTLQKQEIPVNNLVDVDLSHQVQDVELDTITSEDVVLDSDDVDEEVEALKSGDDTLTKPNQDFERIENPSLAEEITISIEEQPLSVMHENLLASLEEKSETCEDFKPFETNQGSLPNKESHVVESESDESEHIIKTDVVVDSSDKFTDKIVDSVVRTEDISERIAPVQQVLELSARPEPEVESVETDKIEAEVIQHPRDEITEETAQDVIRAENLKPDVEQVGELFTPLEKPVEVEPMVTDRAQDTKEVVDIRPKPLAFEIPPILLRQDSRELIDDSKPINPKKRFVKTFEHFEQQLHNEQRKLTESMIDNMCTSNNSDIKTKETNVEQQQIEETQPVIKKHKHDHRKPKSFRGLILERQREEEEDFKYNRTHNLDLDLNELPKKILDSPLHEEFEESNRHEETETALNLVMQSVEKNNETVGGKNVIEPVLDVKLDVTDSKVDNINELDSIKPKNADESQTTAESELNNSIEEYVQTCISFQCSEKGSNDEPEDLSALSTLAAVSELTTSFHDIHNSRHAESSKILADLQNSNDNPNPTFLSEDDFAEGQIEIANIPLPPTKPVSLSSFSVDFPDTKEPASEIIKPRKARHKKEEPDLIERSLGKVFADEFNAESDSSNSAHHDIEDHIPSAVLCGSPNKKRLVEPPEYTSSTKLLEILTDSKPKLEIIENSEVLTKSEGEFVLKPKVEMENVKSHLSIDTEQKRYKSEAIEGAKVCKLKPEIVESTRTHRTSSKFDPKHTKFVIKSSSIIKSAVKEEVRADSHDPEQVSVQKIPALKAVDFEDIDAFIIQKPKKTSSVKDDKKPSSGVLSGANKRITQQIPPVSRGKAKILQQTIIKPATDTRATAISSNVAKVSTSIDDNSMFDIDSMPIVLSDQILTPESIETMPVVLTDATPSTVIKTASPTSSISKQNTEQIKLINKPALNSQSMLLKTYSHKITKDKNVPMLKSAKTQPTIIGRPGSSDKFIIVPPAGSPIGLKTPTKRPALLKKPASVIVPPSATVKVPNASVSEPTGNKIMIVTNQQGQQSRVLLTPAHQKLIGYPGSGSKIVKSTIKGNIMQKASIIKTAVTAAHSKPNVFSSKSEAIPALQQSKVISERKLVLSGKDTSKLSRKIQLAPPKIFLQDNSQSSSRTIVIKNPQGQVVKKIQGVDDALLEQQVQEQVNAIKASGSFAAMKAKQDLTPKSKPLQKRSYGKKNDLPSKIIATSKSQLLLNTSLSTKLQRSETLPPLTPISPKKSDTSSSAVPKVSELKTAMKIALKEAVKKDVKPETSSVQQKPVNQLIIRDTLGNQTTITEGQILALPSGEIVDGQTQSYMLVTLDENGQLTPLNNEALLSLDPNLCLGGDLSNIVMQVDNKLANQNIASVTTTESRLDLETTKVTESEASAAQQTIQTVCNLTGSGAINEQQIIITGDVASTQKFLESLTDGNQDIANLFAGAEGNIIIQTEDQQILFNPNNENQLLLTSGEDSDGALFTSQPAKSQDILAAALADTDVFQQDPCISSVSNKLSQLSPNGSGIYPSSVANVIETTLSLSSPIMTPLEVPSINTKKIPDSETDILTTEVPKNVDLPITITDPTIAQTVSQQQLLAASNNLDIPLSISDPGGVPLHSTEMNSPSFVYALPHLDDHEDIQRKSFTGPISMPLLNEDSQTEQSGKMEDQLVLSKSNKHILFSKGHDRDFLITLDSTNSNELLGDDLCSSLSEPPSDMFDLSVLNTDYRGMEMKQGTTTNTLRPEVLKQTGNFSFIRNGRVTPPCIDSHIASSPSDNTDENSCEIPVQPPIVADLLTSSCENNEPSDYSNKRVRNEDSIENSSKKIKFD